MKYLTILLLLLIGVTTTAQNSLLGTWKGTSEGQEFTFIFHEDGELAMMIDGQSIQNQISSIEDYKISIHYELLDTVPLTYNMIIATTEMSSKKTQKEEQLVMYSFIDENTVVMSDGNRNEFSSDPITFTRVIH